MTIASFSARACIAIAFLVVTSTISPSQIVAQDAVAASPVPVQSAVILSPGNSRISFVGIHVGDDPKPRLGGFEKFSGFAIVDKSGSTVTSLMFDIDVDSVWTQFEKLTTHLKNEDFFETSKYPNAKFVSTSIESDDGGKCKVNGKLTLHGETKEFSFPAEFKFENDGMILKAKFQLDRSEFGMDKMLSGVYKMVDLEIVIGEKTAPSKAQPGNGSDKKKKQSNVDAKSKLQQVSLKLPNMA
jgi:polyisoprenoid-binding protein YceI